MKITNYFTELFKGRKTYLISVLMILLGLLQKDQESVLEGLAILFLRAGISSTAKKTEENLTFKKE